jgi:hypothetical protein
VWLGVLARIFSSPHGNFALIPPIFGSQIPSHPVPSPNQSPMDPLDVQGRKASAAPSFVLDATGMQELLDAMAARKQTGDAAPSVAKRTDMGKAAIAGSTRLRRAMEANFQGAGTAEGRQRPGTTLGLKRKVAAMATAPSVVALKHAAK